MYLVNNVLENQIWAVPLLLLFYCYYWNTIKPVILCTCFYHTLIIDKYNCMIQKNDKWMIVYFYSSKLVKI